MRANQFEVSNGRGDCPARDAPQQPADEMPLPARTHSFARFESTSNEEKKPIKGRDL